MTAEYLFQHQKPPGIHSPSGHCFVSLSFVQLFYPALMLFCLFIIVDPDQHQRAGVPCQCLRILFIPYLADGAFRTVVSLVKRSFLDDSLHRYKRSCLVQLPVDISPPMSISYPQACLLFPKTLNPILGSIFLIAGYTYRSKVFIQHISSVPLAAVFAVCFFPSICY